MVSFFRAIWRGLSALAEGLRKLLTILFLLVFVGGLVLLFRGASPLQIEDNVALVVAPSGLIVEYDDTDPRQRVLDELLGQPPALMEIADLTAAIEAAATDPRIGLLFLKLDEGFQAGQAQLDEIAAAISTFRASGKPVHAWASAMGQQQYFLAAHADRVAIDAMGAVFLNGFEAEGLYFADALEALGVEVHVFRAGEFKSAVEPFTRNDMSPEARSNAQRWLGSLWGQWKDSVAAQREQEPESLQRYADELVQNLEATGGNLAAVAVEQGLVTAAEPIYGARAAAAEIVGRDPEHGSFRQVWLSQYLGVIRREGRQGPLASLGPAKAAVDGGQVIALVHVQGEIVDGEGAPGQAGSSFVRNMIEDATRSEAVAALILRVDSPGGSVSASEEIRQALLAFQETGRPVIASMGSVAASGGYWVSMNADRIVAADSTITGSIGVFGLIPTLERGLDKLGIHADGTGTTIWSGTGNLARPLAEPLRRALDLVVAYDYRLFTETVASAREMPLDRVEEVASGQVWTGRQARELGLVDETGDYARAVALARELAQADDSVPVEVFAPAADMRVRLLDLLSSQIRSEWLASTGWLQTANTLRPFLQNSPRGTFAHCLCDARQVRALP